MTELVNVCLSFENKKVLEGFSIKFPEKGVSYLRGPSGCGKTTLLKLLAGLLKPDSGEVHTEKRVAFMFQEDRLIESVSVLKNVEAVLEPERKDRAAELLKKVGLGEELLSRPEELSGGMRRRTALARALAFDAPLLLLDEPYKGLDEQRSRETAKLISECGKTVIMVTHSAFEMSLIPGNAFYLSGPPLKLEYSEKI